MKEFDFEKANGSPQKNMWLFNNKDKPITRDEFIAVMKEMKQYSSSKKKGKLYTPSYLKGIYKNLQDTFGFFPREKVNLLDL